MGPFRNAVRVGLDCSWGMDRTVQVHAAHCVLKQGSGIVASPGTMLAPALSTDREEQQQHILWSIFRQRILQHSVMHTTAASAVRHTHRHTHIRSHACACAHTNKHKCAREYTQVCTHTYTCTRTNTYTYTHAHACMHTHTQTHRHTRTHICICTRCTRDGER